MNQILVNINFKNEQDRTSTSANDYANDYLKIKVNRIPIWLGQNTGLFHNTDSNRITALIHKAILYQHRNKTAQTRSSVKS